MNSTTLAALSMRTTSLREEGGDLYPIESEISRMLTSPYFFNSRMISATISSSLESGSDTMVSLSVSPIFWTRCFLTVM